MENSRASVPGMAAVLSVAGRLEEKIDLLLEGQESHSEDVEDLEEKLDEAVEEGKGILDTIENTSNTFVEGTEKIVSVSNAAMAAGNRALEVTGIFSTLGLAALLLFLLARTGEGACKREPYTYFPTKYVE